jgi:hypothetical protein
MNYSTTPCELRKRVLLIDFVIDVDFHAHQLAFRRGPIAVFHLKPPLESAALFQPNRLTRESKFFVTEFFPTGAFREIPHLRK